ncbi:MAG: AAA family ATPase, partial [Candidatus Limnocylindrales bacterium]
VDGAPLVVDTRKAVAILVVLATDRRAYAREELAALLWPDSDDEAARGALRRTLSTLRAALPDGGIRIDRSLVELAVGAARIDLAELHRLGASDRISDLGAAAALARGPFLAGFSLRDSPDFDDWRAARSVAVERAVAGVLDRLADAHAAAGDLVAAADVVGRRIDLDPLDEGAHVRRMDLLAATGDRAAALRQYRACVAVLERELGVEPLPETTERYEAIRDSRPAPEMSRVASAPGSPTTVHALPLVGRDATLATIEAVRRSAVADGRIVSVVGEAGIGKTRLIEAAVEHARAAGATVLVARGYAAERSVAYGPIVGWLNGALADPAAAGRLRALPPATTTEMARRVPAVSSVGTPPEATDAAAAQARLLIALVDGLAATVDGPEPGLLVLDDLAWADSATIAVLSSLVRRLTGRRLTLVLSWREEDLEGVVSAFTDHIVELPNATVVAVPRLGQEEVEALVGAAVAGRVAPKPDHGTSGEALWRASEGLPLYVVEALASGSWIEADMPTGVRSVLRARLTPVAGVAQQVLAAAAAIGRSFDLATVRFASGRTEEEAIEALEELTRRAIVREQAAPAGSEVRYDFAHAGLREVAEASTSLARRRLLHRRIAEALRLDVAGEGRDDPGRLARIARHERDAGREVEAAAAFREAGDAARSVFANREAIAHYEAALALGFPAVAAVHLDIGDLRTRLGDYAGAIAAYEGAAALVEP